MKKTLLLSACLLSFARHRWQDGGDRRPYADNGAQSDMEAMEDTPKAGVGTAETRR